MSRFVIENTDDCDDEIFENLKIEQKVDNIPVIKIKDFGPEDFGTKEGLIDFPY